MQMQADRPGPWRRLNFYSDFWLCPAAIGILLAQAGLAGLRREAVEFVAALMLGLAAWSLAEYLIHRFVLHAMPWFRRLHAQHHAAPRGLVGVPAWFSAAMLIALLGWTRHRGGDGVWACGAGVGLVLGYLAYVAFHYATHHLPGLRWRWVSRLRKAHALHHGGSVACNFGVSTPLWDRVFGTAARRS